MSLRRADRLWEAIPRLWASPSTLRAHGFSTLANVIMVTPRRQGFVWTSPRGSEHARDEVHRMVTRTGVVASGPSNTGHASCSPRRIGVAFLTRSMTSATPCLPRRVCARRRGTFALVVERLRPRHWRRRSAAPASENPCAKWCSYSAARKTVFRAGDVD
jgi:hypothetical protein